MDSLSIFTGKVIMRLLKLIGRTGSALPGLVVERMNPELLDHTLSKLKHGVIIVSGTNGKTTTTKIITALLESQGLRVLTNKTGSNFVRGIMSVVVEHVPINGQLPYDVAVFEQDEAHAARLVKLIEPRGVVALNIMRDQLDRFGEIDTTRQYLQKLVAAATDWIVLNANDERISTLVPKSGVVTHWYGHDKALQTDFLTDDQHYNDGADTYFSAATPSIMLKKYTDEGLVFKIGKNNVEFNYALDGTHNAINLTAALAAVQAVMPRLHMNVLTKAVAALRPAFGRGEVFHLRDGVEITLQLVKNPAGFMHALRTLDKKDYGVVGITINDDYADGRDVSWLWDVDFQIPGLSISAVICGGVRGDDMAVRLKYDNIVTEPTVHDLAAFVPRLNDLAKANGNSAIIFCTYTSMLHLRSIYKQYSNEVYEVEV